MTTGLTYSTYLSQVALLTVVPETDPNFLAALPSAITYAENRIYRDLDLLNTLVTDTSLSLSIGSPVFSIPQGTFVTVQNLNVITPSTQTNPNSSTARRNALLPVAKEFIQNVYPSATVTGVPAYFAPNGATTLADGGQTTMQFLVGPWPDAAYTVEVVGTVRPASLSANNTTTFLSNYLPDLMLMATMIYISGYQRNFGRQSDDPQMAQSYESQYKSLLAGASSEEYRKKFQSAAWTSESHSPVASSTRDG